MKGSNGQTMRTNETFPPADIDSVDLEVIKRYRPNMLMCGPVAAVNTTLAILRPFLQQPVFQWGCDTHGSLPQHLTGTLILEHASTAHGEQQRLILDWLDARTLHVQVIATTEEPLFPLVQRGVFLDRLYYKLNMLYLDLGCPE